MRDPCMILLSAVITIDNYITIMLFVKNILWENYFLKSMEPVSARLVWNLNASERICGGLAVAVERTCSFKVIHQLVTESRVGDIINDYLCSFLR